MLQSTKNDQYWSFCYQWWSQNQGQEVFWGNRAFEAVEASEVAEAAEVNEAKKVSKGWKITTEVFKVTQDLEFNSLRTNITLFWKNIFWQNLEKSCWILAPFLSEAAEAIIWIFFENWWMKLKCPNLRNTQIPSFLPKSYFQLASEVFKVCQNLSKDPVGIFARPKKSNAQAKDRVYFWFLNLGLVSVDSFS